MVGGGATKCMKAKFIFLSDAVTLLRLCLHTANFLFCKLNLQTFPGCVVITDYWCCRINIFILIPGLLDQNLVLVLIPNLSR